jgi:hypothetical protein
MRVRILFALTASVSALAAPGNSAAQHIAGVGLAYEAYQFRDPDAAGVSSISLITLPLAARLSLGHRLVADFSTAFAQGRLVRPGGTETSLSGLTDTQVSLSALVAPGRFTLTGIAVLPTGENRHDQAEAELAGAIGADLLPFRISHWSSGGGVGLSAMVAHSFGAIGLGTSVAYLVGQEYDLLDTEDFAYRPGNQLLIRGAVDVSVGPASKLALQLTLQHASDDRVNGSNLFRAGDRYQAIASYTFPVGLGGNAVAYAGMLHRAHSELLLEPGNGRASESLFLAGAGFRIAVGGAVLQPAADVRLVRRSDGTDQGYHAAIGTALEWSPIERIMLVPSAKARFGKAIVREGIESRFTGFDLSMAVRLGADR